MRRLLHPVVEGRTYRELLFLLSAAPLAALWFGLLLAGWLATGLLAVTPLVVPALVVFRAGVWVGAEAEAALARGLLGIEVRAQRPAPGARGYWGRIRAGLSDPAFWSQQAYLFLRMLLGGALAIGLATLIASSVWVIGLPITYRHANGDPLRHHVHTLGQAALGIPVGLAGLLLAVGLIRSASAAWGRLARALLAPVRPPGSAGPDTRAVVRRALRYHAGAWAALGVLLILVWGLTTRGYFWPEWALLPVGLPLAVHAWVVFVDRGDPRRIARTRGLAIHLGATSALWLFFVGVWALTGHGYFWPVWPAIGLAIVLGLHALAAMTSRIDRLTATRAGAVDAAGSELRRIERDLHDGAQARLVALGMSLGLAEQKLASDPEAARLLLVEAREGAGEALRELRDLARGIHPPILADRGLEAALTALASRGALHVAIHVDLPERPPASVEAAAYFVAAEALANAGKHAAASSVQITVARTARELTLTVVDDGGGGADPSGSGLQGIRHRVEALDGTFRLDSPPGGPTTIEAVLPCES